VRGRLRLASLAVAAAALAATLAGCGHSSNNLTSVTIGYPSNTAEHSDLYVCQDQGIFRKHGLDARLTLLKTSSQLVAALSSNTVQIATGDGRAIAAGDLKNTDLKMIALKVPVYFVEMWGKPDIKSINDLRGKKVGVTVPGSVTDSATRIMLADKGLTKDVNLVNLNSLSALTSASESGDVDAMVSSPPAPAKMKSRGWHKITDMTNYKTAASVYAVTGQFAKNNADTVRKFLQADLECLNYLHNDQNHDAIINAIQKYTKTDDRGLVEYAYNFFRKIWQTDPKVDEAAVREAFTRAADGGPVPADLSKFIDNSFLDKLRQEGAIQEPGK
jgi:NitT/TauT family transport system substrate-binding protein